MPRASTLSDVAQLAGVHQATASRALNAASRHLVNAATAERVLAAARELGYVPNAIARGLRTSRTGTIGVIIPDLTNPLFPPIVRGIEDVLAAAGYTALLANTDNDERRERAQFEALITRRVDGFIVATARREHPLLVEAAQRGAKVVLVNRSTESADFSSVTADDALGITLAVRHLVELGHTRIGHLSGPLTVSTGATRAAAFTEALRSHGLEVVPERVVPVDAYSESAGAEATKELLDRDPALTAIVAANDLVALGTCDVLRERKIACPGEISVTGFNDMPFADKFHPALTTVRVPHYDIGAEAGRLLVQQLAEESHLPRRLILPPQFVVRESTGPARAG